MLWKRLAKFLAINKLINNTNLIIEEFFKNQKLINLIYPKKQNKIKEKPKILEIIILKKSLTIIKAYK
jgi:hypothetical protein